MTSRFTELIVDARDPLGLARFWCAVLGYEISEEADGFVEIASWQPSADAIRRAPQPPTIVFVPVPEAKAAKNRLHIDLRAADRTQAEEVQRLVALGATHVDIGQGEQSWVVLADPEGNEFCLLRDLPPAD